MKGRRRQQTHTGADIGAAWKKKRTKKIWACERALLPSKEGELARVVSLPQPSASVGISYSTFFAILCYSGQIMALHDITGMNEATLPTIVGIEFQMFLKMRLGINNNSMKIYRNSWEDRTYYYLLFCVLRTAVAAEYVV